MPGTLNHKTNPPKDVHLHSFSPEYILEQDELFALASTNEKRKTHVSGVSADKSEGGSTGSLPYFEAMHAGCIYVGECVDHPENLPETWWFFLSSLVKHTKDGSRIFHELSSKDPRYSAAETDGQLSRNLKPVTCDYIASDLGYEGCTECPLYQIEFIFNWFVC